MCETTLDKTKQNKKHKGVEGRRDRAWALSDDPVLVSAIVSSPARMLSHIPTPQPLSRLLR